MKQEDAKHAIIELWLSEGYESRTSEDAYLFYLTLIEEKSYLLNFRGNQGDAWQKVHAWLRPYIENPPIN